MKKWRCAICGEIFEGDQPPVPCPVCGGGEDAFEEVEGAPANQWKCTVCGEVFEGEQPPTPCPVCGAGEDAFEPVAAEAREPFRRDTDERFVLVGGGVAAMEAAKAIRARNATAQITMILGEGVVPYNRPGLSDVIGDGLSFINLMLEEYPWFAENGIRTILDRRAEKIDVQKKTVTLTGGDELPYDKLLLATGSNPFNPVKKDADAIEVSTLRTFIDAENIVKKASGKRVIVLGGGILGLEAAVALRERNASVTVLQLESRLLPLQTDEEACARLTAALERKGIVARTGVSIDHVTASGAALTDGSSLEAGFVLVSIGVRSETTLAREAGIEVNRGIVVDEAMRTSAENVFAAGDCAEFDGKAPGLWPVASEQGRTAGANMAGDEATYAPAVAALAFEAYGFKLFSAGTLGGEGLTEIVARTASGAYRKLVFRSGKQLCGVLMEGDVSLSGKALRMIERGASVKEAVGLLAVL